MTEVGTRYKPPLDNSGQKLDSAAKMPAGRRGDILSRYSALISYLGHFERSVGRCGYGARRRPLRESIACARPVQALPSYARQTGQQCAACHNGFLELTHYGRQFKLNGYSTGVRLSA